MGNVRIGVTFVDDGYRPVVEETESCRKVITAMLGDDVGAPPRFMQIDVTTPSGKKVQIVIPNSEAPAIVKLDGKPL